MLRTSYSPLPFTLAPASSIASPTVQTFCASVGSESQGRLKGDTDNTMADQLSLVKGTLDILVLKTLSWGAMHGFEITSWLEDRSGGALDVEDSALYQALHRLEERGLVAAEWGMTENNRRARYYTITRAGRTHLRAETSHWLRYAATVSDILGAATRTA